METKTITGITVKETSRELLDEGYIKKIDCKNYWDSHGNRVEYDPTQYKFDAPKKFELWRVTQETTYSTIPDFVHRASWLYILIDGEKFELKGWITRCEVLKTKLKLDCCVGEG